MKKIILVLAGVLLGTVISFAQDISESQVPSVVLNAFKKEFTKATDVEWELKGELYEVDFDIASADHEVWIDAAGTIVKHKQDIKKSNLPENVSTMLKRDFSGYRISDVKKITTSTTVEYQLDLDKANEDWELTVDASGKVINKKAD